MVNSLNTSLEIANYIGTATPSGSNVKFVLKEDYDKKIYTPVGTGTISYGGITLTLSVNSLALDLSHPLIFMQPRIVH